LNKEHPITPPPELVQEWSCDCPLTDPFNRELYVATQAARWGADQQLEQDAKWLDTNALFSSHLTITPSGDALRQAMRPKLPSLKEQALEALKKIEDNEATYLDSSIIHRALKQLND
jgi:hypothetical protein